MKLSLLSALQLRKSYNYGGLVACRFFSAKPVQFKVINSSQTCATASEAAVLNAARNAQLAAYQAELSQTRHKHAEYARTLPTRTEREEARKSSRRLRNDAAWSEYVERVKQSLHPPVAELQAAGKLPKPLDAAARAKKAAESNTAAWQAESRAILMRRKYLAYLAGEVLPQCVTRDNLDARVQAAIERPTSYNLTASAVVSREKSVNEALRQIRVDMPRIANETANETAGENIGEEDAFATQPAASASPLPPLQTIN
jgi:hypothetical protein